MNLSNYLIPTVTPVPMGYDCVLPIPLHRLAPRLLEGSGTIRWETRMFQGGRQLEERVEELRFASGRLVSTRPDDYSWKRSDADWAGNSGFIENSFTIADGTARFTTKQPVPFYSLYRWPGRKGFRSDGDQKFAAPAFINQIAAFGRYIDGYPVVRLDRERDYGESLSMINPYTKAIIAEIRSHDGRIVRPIRVEPRSARNTQLVALLKDGEPRWTGRIQISANNRLMVFHIRHSLADPTCITDHEHLDPYRGDPTHLPGFKWLRQRIGTWLDGYGINWSRLK